MNRWLSLICIFLILLITGLLITTQLKEQYLRNDPVLHDLQRTLEPMFSSDQYFTGNLKPLNNYNIFDRITLYRGEKSYTINKEKIFLCLKDDNGNYYNKNMLIYVLLHEIAHSICNEIGHTKKFNDIFEELLDKATEMGIYNPSIPIIQDYCANGDPEV